MFDLIIDCYQLENPYYYIKQRLNMGSGASALTNGKPTLTGMMMEIVKGRMKKNTLPSSPSPSPKPEPMVVTSMSDSSRIIRETFPLDNDQKTTDLMRKGDSDSSLSVNSSSTTNSHTTITRPDGSSRLRHVQSIRKLAKKHVSRHRSAYIHHDIMNQSFHQLIHQLGSSSSSTSTASDTTTKLTVGKKTSFTIEIPGEEDWEHVEEEEEEDDDEPSMLSPRNSSTQKTLALKMGAEDLQSYWFTQTGTVFVKGVEDGIKSTGMVYGIEPQSATSPSSSNQPFSPLLDQTLNTNNNNSSMFCFDDTHRSLLSLSSTSSFYSSLLEVGPSLTFRERIVVLCRLGSGATGVVYKALDLLTLRLVALKVIPIFDKDKRRQIASELSTLHTILQNQKKKKREMRRRLERKNKKNKKKNDDSQTSTLQRDEEEEEKKEELDSSHKIVQFLDAFSNLDDATIVIMMEFMDGGSLQDIVDGGGCRDEGTLANITKQALEGLSFLHTCHQIHRDIKPANMLIDMRGTVKVSDFGITKQLETEEEALNNNKKRSSELERANTFVGTVTYMSPVLPFNLIFLFDHMLIVLLFLLLL